VSNVARLADAAVSCTNPFRAAARSDAWHRLASQAKVQRGWGDCYGHILVATGRIEAMLDPAISPWDCAPLLPILREAGGMFTTWAGEPTIWGPDAVSTNAALHETVMQILKSERLT
jgi:fructose-1,6-bisphosphatase/inositol monophosphatase family enzyme